MDRSPRVAPGNSAARDRASGRILNAAIALFKARGYHGTSMRALAQVVRIEASSLYYHFPSKQHILFALFERTMDAVLEGMGRAMASGSTPEAQLRAAIRFHVLFHVGCQDEAFISHSELRSLSVRNRRRVVAKRHRYEHMIRALLIAGVRTGVFEIADVRLTSTTILVMCSGVADWFAPRRRLTAAKVADRYVDLVIRLLARQAGAPSRQTRGATASRKVSSSRQRT